ncbi:hypothetical protein [Ralstonia pseudosolanacearum]
MKSNKPNQRSKLTTTTKEKNMESNQDGISLSALRSYFVEMFIEHGKELEVLNILLKSVLIDMKDEGFKVRDPLEMVHLENGQDLIAGWCEVVGGMRLTHIFAILGAAGAQLPDGVFLTDLTKVELVTWTNDGNGVNFQLNVGGMYPNE